MECLAKQMQIYVRGIPGRRQEQEKLARGLLRETIVWVGGAAKAEFCKRHVRDGMADMRSNRYSYKGFS